MIIAILATFMASSGFWAWMSKRTDRKSATTRLVLGLAHDRIIFLGMKYLDRGYLTKDEYEDLNHYLYEPYSEFGGNGLAKRVMDDVANLPFRPTASYWPTEAEKSP